MHVRLQARFAGKTLQQMPLKLCQNSKAAWSVCTRMLVIPNLRADSVSSATPAAEMPGNLAGHPGNVSSVDWLANPKQVGSFERSSAHWLASCEDVALQPVSLPRSKNDVLQAFQRVLFWCLSSSQKAAASTVSP